MKILSKNKPPLLIICYWSWERLNLGLQEVLLLLINVDILKFEGINFDLDDGDISRSKSK